MPTVLQACYPNSFAEVSLQGREISKGPRNSAGEAPPRALHVRDVARNSASRNSAYCPVGQTVLPLSPPPKRRLEVSDTVALLPARLLRKVHEFQKFRGEFQNVHMSTHSDIVHTDHLAYPHRNQNLGFVQQQDLELRCFG